VGIYNYWKSGGKGAPAEGQNSAAGLSLLNWKPTGLGGEHKQKEKPRKLDGESNG